MKHYSSGMYMRLAFAVAAHLEPEILLVDEVLAVGDAAFQKKCLGKMNDVAQGGRTVLFVSHNMGAINALCTSAIWIDKGSIREQGAAQTVVQHYLESVREGFIVGGAKPDDKLVIDRVLLKNAAGEVTTTFRGDRAAFRRDPLHGPPEDREPALHLSVMGPYGDVFTAAMTFDNLTPDAIEGFGDNRLPFLATAALAPDLLADVGARGGDGTSMLMASKYDAAFFTVVGLMSDYGLHARVPTPSATNTNGSSCHTSGKCRTAAFGSDGRRPNDRDPRAD